MAAPIRILTATAIFDGHDASINIVRRVLQDQGAEIIHLGHNHSVDDIVNAAIQEDVDAIAISSYQGGHIEFFRYLIDKLNEINREQHHDARIQVFAGGGGTITDDEAQLLQNYGVTRVFSSREGASLGLEGMARYILERCQERKRDYTLPNDIDIKSLNMAYLSRCISALESSQSLDWLKAEECLPSSHCKVIGITGTGGSGKSTLIDELLKALLACDQQPRIAYLAIDPTRQKSGGALLGDRIRINSQYHPRLFMRSIATREANVSVTPIIDKIICLLKQQHFDLVLVETAGIGQSDANIKEFVDESIYVMTRDYGAPSQLEKIEMLDFASIVVVNKCDQQGSEDSYHDICRQWLRNHPQHSDSDISNYIFPMVASQFNDSGLKNFINHLLSHLSLADKVEPQAWNWQAVARIIPERRRQYLAEISGQAEELLLHQQKQQILVQQLEACHVCLATAGDPDIPEFLDSCEQTDLEVKTSDPAITSLRQHYNELLQALDPETIELLKNWPAQYRAIINEHRQIDIRNETVTRSNYQHSISNTPVPLLTPPGYSNQADLLAYLFNENLPGEFPYTAGVFHYRNTEESPTRMFAGEGTPEDTNRRFFYLIRGQTSKRLSTAFDPVTLYGMDPVDRPDTRGCIGMSGVSVACLDDMKKLYSGIDLCDKNTSVSMTINGPAPVLLAWFFNVAIDQQIEKHLKATGGWSTAEEKIKQWFKDKPVPRYCGDLPSDHDGLGLATLGIPGKELVDQETWQRIKNDTLKDIRGTLQADILKEELAQNECIFSLEFGLQMMADIQAYFIDTGIGRFYSVSVSGYHIAEAGANPITQLAFTLADGFTLVEYYLSRGMSIDDFAGQFSFFFSNGMDPEYAVIGRVARRIWARAMRYRYHANSRSQKLKYHIQTSGRSLQAEDINLNDIRTTLQALYAINDNCNSLHTNAYDEAVTTPTEESVHRALAIQMIINQELGSTINQNPLQGSFFINKLTDLVEQAVYREFDRLSERGGVPGAIETFYQRNKIQQESLLYQHKKNDGSLPIIGVNCFQPDTANSEKPVRELIRSTDKKKQQQIDNLKAFKLQHADHSGKALRTLENGIREGQNSFNCLMETCQFCTLEEITATLGKVGGIYRRKM